eukprot:TRINITY_DN20914_c0_g1_i8.p1 TRINITY_DN20914_c0_g1~~TRINITY_DN20914_c0_g1_i8.p1  ORF type:complete len:741 (-),score=133.35 TRINITY_DN20914_c0_g1_i8:173-2395(-)
MAPQASEFHFAPGPLSDSAAVDMENQALLPVSMRHAWFRQRSRRLWQLLGGGAVLAGLAGVGYRWRSALSRRSSSSDELVLDEVPSTYTVFAETSFGRAIGQRIDSDFSVGNNEHCEQWLGLPYAKPPVASRRFAPVQAWDEAYPPEGLEAAIYGPLCAQMASNIVKGAEDCLYLNLWRPVGLPAGARLPVMLWIHGGGFIHGSGQAIVESGCRLASKEVIVVSFNYRLGPFGFAAFRDSQGKVQANLALDDQREAMRWLQREVAAFGGDPGKVTIFGQSAGAMSVMIHVASPSSKGLFRAAISESGRADAFALDFSLDNTQRFVERAGCANETSVLDCMRNQSFVTLLHSADLGGNLFFKAGWMPTVDGTSLPDYPHVLFQQGKTNHLPLLLGVNSDETRKFVWQSFPDVMDGTSYMHFILDALNSNHLGPGISPSDAEKIFALYSQMDKRADERYIAAEVLNDATYHCSSVEVANAYSSIAPVFFYRFDYRSDWNEKHSSVPGVPHCVEKPFVFQSRPSRMTEKELALSNRMQELWRGFATNLQPAAPDVWPRYLPPIKTNVVFYAENVTLQQAWKANRCEFWNNLLYMKYFQRPTTNAITSAAPTTTTALPPGTTASSTAAGFISNTTAAVPAGGAAEAATTPADAPVALTAGSIAGATALATAQAATEFTNVAGAASAAFAAPTSNTPATTAAPASTTVVESLETEANALAAILSSGSSNSTEDEYKLINEFHMKR